eukprot:CAMPEP_0172184954 /NCGR_PEP_ID=MMETSP1050-20130122/19882_1 /TAXON_ID=233186 /ORGANISM="Cryptomonas curvata, Strain CCAP979/52" /LENGTH=212 /DNA_ID=CAMNT_0012858849 /DNA_START=144 /DNA_END=778 /DNA_ORIENTATION=-
MGDNDNYEQIRQIGAGAMGFAYLVRRRSDGQSLVKKRISLAGLQDEDRSKAMQEADCLRSLKHPNIIELCEAFTENDDLCIIMEYADGGDLAKYIKDARPNLLGEDKVLDIFAQACRGLEHVHRARIIHRDIKSANILLTAGGSVKLADFGVARILSSQTMLANTCIGTPYYLSPEICEGRGYDEKADIWSLGCVLYELATLAHAFAAPNLP